MSGAGTSSGGAEAHDRGIPARAAPRPILSGTGGRRPGGFGVAAGGHPTGPHSPAASVPAGRMPEGRPAALPHAAEPQQAAVRFCGLRAGFGGQSFNPHLMTA